MPTQSARRGTLFTSDGKLKLLNKKYETDTYPIDKECSCFVCKNYTRAYIRFLLREEEASGMELASFHNIFFMHRLIDEVKTALKKNTFQLFVKKIKSVYR